MKQISFLKECKKTHTITTTATGSKNLQKEGKNQTDYQSHNDWAPPPQSLSFTGLRTQLKSSARHTLSNQQAQLQKLRLVNLIENDAKSLSRLLAWLV